MEWALHRKPKFSQRILQLCVEFHPSCNRGEVGECEQRCAALLRANPFNDEAGDILVYLMIHRELYEAAILHFQQILERDPNHYSALSQVSHGFLASIVVFHRLEVFKGATNKCRVR